MIKLNMRLLFLKAYIKLAVFVDNLIWGLPRSAPRYNVGDRIRTTKSGVDDVVVYKRYSYRARWFYEINHEAFKEALPLPYDFPASEDHLYFMERFFQEVLKENDQA